MNRLGKHVSIIYFKPGYVVCVSFQFNMKDSSVRLAYEAQPRPKAIASLAGESIVKVACGTNHTGRNLISFFLLSVLNLCLSRKLYTHSDNQNFSKSVAVDKNGFVYT